VVRFVGVAIVLGSFIARRTTPFVRLSRVSRDPRLDGTLRGIGDVERRG